ncbi:MDR family MFS transporter [Streptomyces sp. NPDC056716]|uniref:MDR family MFS transporter n=1 Tax=unclassified Streptomyces TaxID=2593676 RepID=UPI0036C33581
MSPTRPNTDAGHDVGARRGPRFDVSQKLAVGIVYVAGIFLSTLDMTIVNIALPSIGRAFDVPSTSVDIVSVSYLVSLAVFVPCSGWLGDRFGGKRTLLTAITVFTLASALCGTATSLGQLIAFRVLQGAGGGMLASVGMAMLLRAYRPEERVRASAILTMANGLAPTLGPVLGGILVSQVSWRAIFYVNVPFGVLAVIFGILCLRNEPARPAERLDFTGFLLAASGFGVLMFGISEGPERGWGSPPVLAGLLCGGALLTGLVLVSVRKKAPMMDFRLLRIRLFAAGTTAMTMQSATFLGTLFLITLYLQDVRGMTPMAAGLATFPQSLGVAVGSQLASRLLYRKLKPRRQLMLGAAGTSVAVALMALLLDETTPLWLVIALLVLMGLAVGQVFLGTQSASFATVSDASSGRASTLFNVGRRIGGAFGVAVVTTVLVSASGSGGAADMAGYRAAFITAAALNLLGLYAATRVSDTDAAPTIPPPRGRRRPTPAAPRPTPSPPDPRPQEAPMPQTPSPAHEPPRP